MFDSAADFLIDGDRANAIKELAEAIGIPPQCVLSSSDPLAENPERTMKLLKDRQGDYINVLRMASAGISVDQAVSGVCKMKARPMTPTTVLRGRPTQR